MDYGEGVVHSGEHQGMVGVVIVEWVGIKRFTRLFLTAFISVGGFSVGESRVILLTRASVSLSGLI